MPADSLVKLKLSVWRDFVPSKATILLRGDENGTHTLTDTNLQQEVYSWQMREDPFGGVSEESARQLLREVLIDRFEASQPPQSRRVAALKEFIDQAQKVIDAGQAEWTTSQEAPFEDEDVPYRLNPLLALRLHLEWLMNSFAGQPGVSVSIR